LESSAWGVARVGRGAASVAVRGGGSSSASSGVGDRTKASGSACAVAAVGNQGDVRATASVFFVDASASTSLNTALGKAEHGVGALAAGSGGGVVGLNDVGGHINGGGSRPALIGVGQVRISGASDGDTASAGGRSANNVFSGTTASGARKVANHNPVLGANGSEGNQHQNGKLRKLHFVGDGG